MMVGMEGVVNLSLVREGVGEEEVEGTCGVPGGGLLIRWSSGDWVRLTVSRYIVSALRQAAGMS